MSVGQRRRFSLAAAALLAGPLAALIALQSHGQQVADEQVEKPEVRVGDSWSYGARITLPKPSVRSYTTTVTFVGPDVILTAANVADATQREGNANWTSEWNPRSLGRGMVYAPYAGYLKFPLKVGATFESKYELAGIRGQGDGARYAFESVAKVTAWEEVVVPAGKFRALKVEIDSKLTRLDARGEAWARHVIWWAPEVERWVKTTFEDGAATIRTSESHELTAFKLVESKPK